MDRPTVEIYEAASREYEAARTPRHLPQAQAFGALASAGLVADLGCGPGWYTAALGAPAIALDAAHAMLRRTRDVAPAALAVQADLQALPLRRGALAGAWARNSYVHLRAADLPLALADLHRCLRVDAPVQLTLFGHDRPGPDHERRDHEGHDHEGHAPQQRHGQGGPEHEGPEQAGPDHHDREHEGRGVFPGDDFPGRWFSTWSAARVADVMAGAGFGDVAIDGEPMTDGTALTVHARRAATLPDTVGPGMRLLVCGLNPSVRAADAGVGFVTPGNRFWPAALDAGIVSVDRDPRHALLAHGVGMTDLVKRATPRADALTRAEYGAGAERLDRLCAWLQPGAVCVVGLAGWRAAVDRRTTPGWQTRSLGSRPVYVMPSTSGLNAGSSVASLTDHLRAAAAGPPR